MKLLKLLPALLLLAILFTRAVSQELRAGLVRSLSPGVVSIEGRWRDPVTGKLGKVEIAGSGFFVDEQGRVITCYHVIDGLKEIAVRTKSGGRFKVRLIKTQKDADLALLSLTPLPRQQFVRLPITSAIPEIEAELIAIGSSMNLPGTVSNGIMSGIRNISESDPDLDYAGQILQMTTPVSPGLSGGPVIGLNGQVYGVVVARTETEFRPAQNTGSVEIRVKTAKRRRPRLPRRSKIFGRFLDVVSSQRELPKSQNIHNAIPSHRVLNFLLPYYHEIAAKTPSDPAAYFNLGRIHDALSHHSEAESAYRKSLRLKESADACRALGVLFLTRPVNANGKSKTARKREYTEKAIEYLTRAIEIAPDDGKARYNLAVAYFEINKKDQARLQCNALLKLRGKQKLAQPVLGNAVRLCSWSSAPFK